MSIHSNNPPGLPEADSGLYHGSVPTAVTTTGNGAGDLSITKVTAIKGSAIT